MVYTTSRRLWDLTTFSRLALLTYEEDPIISINLNRAGTLVVSGSVDGDIR